MEGEVVDLRDLGRLFQSDGALNLKAQRAENDLRVNGIS